MLLEERLIYFPTPYPDGFEEIEPLLADPRGPAIEDRFFDAEDGVRLHAWRCRPRGAEGALPTLLLFHGNAGNLAYRYDFIRRLATLPVEVLALDYRGYGRSRGEPSEDGLYRDARAAWAQLVEALGVSPGRIVVLGKSLGGAVAVELATRVKPAGLVVQSSFTSARDMAATLLPFLPAALLRTRLDSLARIAGMSCPKLFVHSPADEVVPYRLGRRLYDAAPEPKQFLDVAGAAHNDLYLVGGQAYLDRLARFVRSCVGGGA